MRVEFNRTGAERKALVTTIGEILERKPRYMGMPTMAYDFDGLIVDKTGAVEFDSDIFPKDIERFLQDLAGKGFIAETRQGSRELEEPVRSEDMGFTISIPIEYAKIENLRNLLEVKGDLIKKALGITDIGIEISEDMITFPWFETMPDAEAVQVYSRFICKLCEMSKKQKRINHSEKKAENEKYAFRCFLLRLGFIGEEYKLDRKILLKNLTGSSAFRNGGKNDDVSK